jgi:hypothetical protein
LFLLNHCVSLSLVRVMSKKIWLCFFLSFFHFFFFFSSSSSFFFQMSDDVSDVAMSGLDAKKVARLFGLLESRLRERDARILFLERQLKDHDDKASLASTALLSELLATAEESSLQPVPAEQPVPFKPILSSRLSASGTDFSSFSKRHYAKGNPDGAVGESGGAGLHSTEAEIELVPVPRSVAGGSSGSPNLANRRMHLNDLNSLAVKSRRQHKQPVGQMSESVDETVPDLQHALKSETHIEAHLASSPLPVDVLPGPSPVPAPPLARVVTNSALGRAVVPPVETVRAALLERGPFPSVAGNTSPSHQDETVPRKRSSMALKSLFKSAFPKRQGHVFGASGPVLWTAADGGFQSHSACFGGRPLFGSAPAFRVEAYAEDDGAWTFSPSTVGVPSSFQLVLSERKDRGEPKVWIWEQEALVLVVWLQHADHGNVDAPNCVFVTMSSQSGARKSWTRISNLQLMSSEERSHHVVAVCAGPLVPVERAIRVKAAKLVDLWPRLLELERNLARRVLDVDYCELVPLGMDRKVVAGAGTRRASLTGSRTATKPSALSVLCQKSEVSGQETLRLDSL